MPRSPRPRRRPVVVTSTAEASGWKVDLTKPHASPGDPTSTQAVGVAHDPLEAAELMLNVLRTRTKTKRK